MIFLYKLFKKKYLLDLNNKIFTVYSYKINILLL
jgi:hypothetical protein